MVLECLEGDILTGVVILTQVAMCLQRDAPQRRARQLDDERHVALLLPAARPE